MYLRDETHLLVGQTIVKILTAIEPLLIYYSLRKKSIIDLKDFTLSMRLQLIKIGNNWLKAKDVEKFRSYLAKPWESEILLLIFWLQVENTELQHVKSHNSFAGLERWIVRCCAYAWGYRYRITLSEFCKEHWNAKEILRFKKRKVCKLSIMA